jgi:hypothetical protein
MNHDGSEGRVVRCSAFGAALGELCGAFSSRASTVGHEIVDYLQVSNRIRYIGVIYYS